MSCIFCFFNYENMIRIWTIAALMFTGIGLMAQHKKPAFRQIRYFLWKGSIAKPIDSDFQPLPAFEKERHDLRLRSNKSGDLYSPISGTIGNVYTSGDLLWIQINGDNQFQYTLNYLDTVYPGKGSKVEKGTLIGKVKAIPLGKAYDTKLFIFDIGRYKNLTREEIKEHLKALK